MIVPVPIREGGGICSRRGQANGIIGKNGLMDEISS
jgi:hypothetical protein